MSQNNSSKHKSKKGYDYEVLLSIVLFLLILFLIFRKNHAGLSNYLLYGAMGLGIASLISKSFATLLTKAWGKLLAGIGFVNSRILLSLIFFVVLLPISLLARVFRKESLLQLKKNDKSYFTERNHTYEGKDLENTW